MVPGVLQGGGLGRKSLDNDFSGKIAAAGAARYLRQELESAFPCTGIRDVEPQVRVQYAYQRHVGKIQTFGDHLGAQENIYLMGAKLVQNGPDGVFPPGHVRIHARDARRRESAAQEFLHFLGSVPLEQDVGGPAFRAGTGREGFESAQVAHEAVFRTVVGQGQGAVQARDYVAAVRALDGACESAPVEQQDDLFPLVETPVNGHPEAFGDNVGTGFVPSFRFHVQDANERELLAVRPFRQFYQGIFSSQGVMDAFQGGSGRAKKHGAIFQMGAQHGQIPPVVAGGAFLFVRGVVFFIHNHQAQILEGGEDGGTGTDDDAGFSGTDGMPFVKALPVREEAVQHCHGGRQFRETGFETLNRLGRQGNFRHHDQGGFSGFYYLGNGL